jgi:hypothetical protein
MNPDDLLNYAAAIRSIESSGNYGSLGPATRSGDRAYGAYQVMGNNIPSWTQKHYGQSLTPEQFLQNKQAQDAVFNGEFGGYLQKHGNPQDAASMWFSGRPMAQAGNSSDGYNTVPQYIQKFNKALGQDGGALSAINSAAGTNPQDLPAGALGFAAAGQGGGALSNPQAQQAADSGVLFQGEQPNKLHTIGSTLANVGAAIAGISNPSQGANLRAIAQGIDAQNTGNFQYQMGPNGQLLRINKKTSAVDSIAIPDGQKESFKPIMGKDDSGNPTLLGSYNATTGEYKPVGGVNAAANATPIGGDPNLTGQDRYDSLTSDEKKQIDAWKAGTGIQPSQYSMRNPKVGKLVDAANAIGIDMSKYGARQAMVRDLAKSTPGSAGGQLDSSAAMIDHVTDLADDYIKLHNTGGYGGSVVNAAKNAMTPSGSERDQVLKSIATHSMNFSGEVTKQLAGAPGGQEERQRRVDLINQPRGAPATQAAALEAELSDAINKRQATLDRVKDTMGEDYISQNPRLQKQAEKLELAKKKLLELRNGPAIKDTTQKNTAAPAAAMPDGWSYLGSK